jgi:NADH-quinone oxidoreductase subunit B
MLIDAILKLHDKIGDMKLGPNRRREIAQEEALALSAPATIEMKGLLR